MTISPDISALLVALRERKEDDPHLDPPPGQGEGSESPSLRLERGGALPREPEPTIPPPDQGHQAEQSGAEQTSLRGATRKVRKASPEYISAELPSVSLIVITRDEEAVIGQCLASARTFCRELVVVDSGSTDRTVEIARSMGAMVVAHEFTDYVRQKQIALDHASSEWVLLLDADEQATYELGREIERAICSAHPADGYRIRRVLYHLRHYYTRAIYPDRPVRLFRRTNGYIGGIDPHDKVVVNGRVEQLRAPILHFSYRDIAAHVDTINRFSTRSAAQVRPSPLTVVRMFTHPLWYFFNFYVLRGGFLEGAPGFYAATTAAFYAFVKYAKVYERRLSMVRPH